MEKAKRELIEIETAIAMAVSSVHCVVTKAMIEKRDNLRAAVGMEYDAINRKWVA